MKKFLKITGAASLAALALCFSGCNVDDTYTLENLKNIDKDITLFQNGFQLKLVESTAEIRVDSLIKSFGLDSSGVIKQAADGSYYLEFADTLDFSDEIAGIGLSEVVKIDAIDFSEDVSYPIASGIDISSIPDVGDVVLPTLSYDFDKEVTFDFMGSDQIPEMLVAVGDVVLDDVYATVNLLFDDLPDENASYTLDATATLPDFFDPNSIELKGAVSNGVVFSRNIKLNKFDLSSYDFATLRTNGENISTTIKIVGSASAENVTVNSSSIVTDVSGKVAGTVCNADSKIAIKSLQAKVDYEISQKYVAQFVSLPDVLADATIELPDVTADLTVRTNLAFPLSGQADLKAFGASDAVAVLNFEVPYCYSPDTYEEKTTRNTININSLLNESADSLELNAILKTDKTSYCYIEPAAEYGLQLAYDLTAPIQLGTGTLIPFADTTEIGSDSGKTIGQVLQGNSIGLTANVVNTLPLSLSISVEFLSYDENSGIYTLIPLQHEIKSDEIAANATSTLELLIGMEKDNKALENMTHLRFSIEIRSNGEALKGDESVKLTDIMIVLPNGIHVDGNELFDNEEENK